MTENQRVRQAQKLLVKDRFNIEYTKSKRHHTVCQGCRNGIEFDERVIRIALNFGAMVYHLHIGCFREYEACINEQVLKATYERDCQPV